jgi:hypothetical protein
LSLSPSRSRALTPIFAVVTVGPVVTSPSVPTVTTGPTAISASRTTFGPVYLLRFLHGSVGREDLRPPSPTLSLCTHFELLTLEFIVGIDGIDGKAAPPPSIPTIPSMFLCKFASDQPQILRWLRWWILTLTDATNAHFCTFAFLLHPDLATVATVQPGSYRRYFSRSLRFVGLNSLASTQGVQVCTLFRGVGTSLPPPGSIWSSWGGRGSCIPPILPARVHALYACAL